MGIRVEQCLTCGNNPAGITINLGWYALAECIWAESNSGAALFRWCGLHQHPQGEEKPEPPPQKPKPKKKPKKRPGVKGHPKTDKIIALYIKNPNLRNKEIAKKVRCTQEMVSKVLISMGIRRNRWDGYISTDPRYSQKKKGEQKSEKVV